MPRVEPLPRESLPQYEDTFRAVESALGVLPNSTLTMARRPAVMEAFARLNAVVMAEGGVDGVLKQLVAAVVSGAAGCAYCQAHTSHVAEQRGADAEKLAAVWEFETNPLFTAAERAALRVARGAGLTPNAVTDEDMAELQRHFDDEQVVEIVAVIANFGFLNRWNDTMATELERSPMRWATDNLQRHGWDAGKHTAGEPTSGR
ncbi:carboxymuconolactone decarboxylase family protein [Blastococcus saxobsidens]|uniref:Putative carboxymuconolactone decarboxylase n=1 Tax=Blastococcus saxobsidens (strain DD2) TaxID=1146883 RepID=H6RMA7_BLASD|nr:carboxymuconolactone decarboxylase family protein [Blastococcus saxobsidens]CCG02543.1 Putative carboxymuconolactone decarboxylase [Blastococcus saxobsidens DD2]